MHTDRETDTYTHVSLTQMVMETLIIYSIKKVYVHVVFIVNQRKSCGLSNLVESQGTCNKKKSGQKN